MIWVKFSELSCILTDVLARCGRKSAAVSLSSAALSVPLSVCILKMVLNTLVWLNTVQISLVVLNSSSLSLGSITNIKAHRITNGYPISPEMGKNGIRERCLFYKKVCVE